MTSRITLDKNSRDFFRIVAKIAFSNPFGTEALQLAYQIAGGQYEAGVILRDKVNDRVRQRLEKATAKGGKNWKAYTGEDQEIIRIAQLHSVYNICSKDFDNLIVSQIKAGPSPCPVPFAKDILTLLRQQGFSAKEALLYFAFFYQLRRAWYFIYYGLIGQNPSMEGLRSHLWNNIFTYDPRWYEKFLWDRMEDFSTILIGETGTGKGTAAAAIGRSGFIPFNEKKGHFSESFTTNFIEINLSQYPESLIESELFGHKKGSFTGAVEDHQGVFDRSRPHGAIFLDEIGDLSIPVQIKLLKVLQERTFSAVGSHKKQRFSGRVIAATNKSLEELRKQGLFRDDFYYRLCSDVIIVPNLRQQIKENPRSLDSLIDHKIQQIVGEPVPALLDVVREIIEKEITPDYSWPGNVRELEQAVRRILLTRHYQGDTREVVTDKQNLLQRGIDDGLLNAQELLTSYCALLYQRHGTYEEVARITKLDRRTVKKYVLASRQ